jgi:hypothetical protein
MTQFDGTSLPFLEQRLIEPADGVAFRQVDVRLDFASSPSELRWRRLLALLLAAAGGL